MKRYFCAFIWVVFVYLSSAVVHADEASLRAEFMQIIDQMKSDLRQEFSDALNDLREENSLLRQKLSDYSDAKINVEELVQETVSQNGFSSSDELDDSRTVKGDPFWFLGVKTSYLRPEGLSNLNFAVLEHPFNPNGNIGEHRSIGFKNELSTLFTAGYKTAAGLELSAHYWGLGFKERESLSGSSGPGERVGSTLFHPQTDASSFDVANAKMAVDIDRFGVNSRMPIFSSDAMSFSLDSGLWYMRTDTDFRVDLFQFDRFGRNIFLRTDLDGRYLGPRLGLSAQHQLPLLKNVSLSANFGFTPLFQRQSLTQIEGPRHLVEAPIDISDSRDGMTFATDAEISVAWKFHKEWSVSLGYEYFWMKDFFFMTQGLDDTSETQTITLHEDLLLHGFNLGINIPFK